MTTVLTFGAERGLPRALCTAQCVLPVSANPLQGYSGFAARQELCSSVQPLIQGAGVWQTWPCRACPPPLRAAPRSSQEPLLRPELGLPSLPCLGLFLSSQLSILHDLFLLPSHPGTGEQFRACVWSLPRPGRSPIISTTGWTQGRTRADARPSTWPSGG